LNKYLIKKLDIPHEASYISLSLIDAVFLVVNMSHNNDLIQSLNCLNM